MIHNFDVRKVGVHLCSQEKSFVSPACTLIGIIKLSSMRFQDSHPGEVAQRLGQEVHLTTAMTKALTDFLKSEIEKRTPAS